MFKIRKSAKISTQRYGGETNVKFCIEHQTWCCSRGLTLVWSDSILACNLASPSFRNVRSCHCLWFGNLPRSKQTKTIDRYEYWFEQNLEAFRPTSRGKQSWSKEWLRICSFFPRNCTLHICPERLFSRVCIDCWYRKYELAHHNLPPFSPFLTALSLPPSPSPSPPSVC
jgi:hypothetical protein